MKAMKKGFSWFSDFKKLFGEKFNQLAPEFSFGERSPFENKRL